MSKRPGNRTSWLEIHDNHVQTFVDAGSHYHATLQNGTIIEVVFDFILQRWFLENRTTNTKTPLTYDHAYRLEPGHIIKPCKESE